MTYGLFNTPEKSVSVFKTKTDNNAFILELVVNVLRVYKDKLDIAMTTGLPIAS